MNNHSDDQYSVAKAQLLIEGSISSALLKKQDNGESRFWEMKEYLQPWRKNVKRLFSFLKNLHQQQHKDITKSLSNSSIFGLLVRNLLVESICY